MATQDDGWTVVAPAAKATSPASSKDEWTVVAPAKSVPSNKAAPTKDAGGWETIKPATKESGITDSLKAGGEAFVRGLPATGGFWAGSAAGTAAVAPIAAPIAPAAPIVAGAIEFAGGLAGGLITSGGVAWATDRLSKLMDPEGYAKWEKTQQEHSTATTVGSFAAGFAGSSYKTAAEQAGKVWTKPVAQRATSGVAMGGLDAVQQAITTGEVDPKSVAASAVGGALLPGANVAGKFAGAVGGAAAKAVMPKEKTTTTVGDLPPKPPEGATPEERAAYIEKLKEIKADRDAKAPLVEAALRNKETGELERMGPKHDQARKEATKDTHEEGFVDSYGVFHERQAAVDQAKRAGQIPEDHVLENPPGEREGLHSGDLRKVGDERFAVSEDKPAGVPSNTRPVTLDDTTPPKFLYHGTKAEPEIDAAGNLVLRPSENFEGKTSSVSLTHDENVATDYAARIKGGGPEGFDFKGAKTIKIHSDALPEGVSRESGKEWAFNTTKPVVIPKGKFEVVEHPLSKEATPEQHQAEVAKMQSNLDTWHEEQPVEWNKPKEAEPAVSEKLSTDTTPEVAKEAATVDPRSIPNEEEFVKHATDIYERYGEDKALEFFEAYKENLNERSIPVPNNNEQLDNALHKVNMYETKDRSEHVTGYENNTKNGVTDEQRAKWFDMRERGEELPPEAKAILDDIDAENIALVRKARGMGLEVGAEFTTGQSRIRLFSEKERPGWKDTIKKFFSNDTPMGDKVADQANAAIERKVYQTDDGRVIEFHRIPEDTKIPIKDKSGKVTGYRDVKKGTEVWEWKDGKKQLLTHSDDIGLKVGDKISTKKFSDKLSDGPVEGTASERRTLKPELTIVDGKVLDIERHSPYRYLHDAEASARMANMGLRKMVREAEFVENLKKSEMFKVVGHGPDQPLKDLPKGWVVPSNIDRIPQLRGWHFDPKTAAIIEDFAKVWDNSMWMNMTNALVKNMMLNPIPHMFNEVMHVWNARGFTGWVSPGRLGDLAVSGRRAWRDVGNQTQLYRDVMREGGSLLGADPRNKGYFDTIVKDAQKQMFGTPEMERNMKSVAKKLGTTVGNLYNGVSEASQKAMWFTRDVMYMQLIHESMMNHEKRTGQRMELKDAIYEVERHMPNYRLPSEVMGSRSVSKVLRNPNVSMFSRYHYGMVKSLVNTIKDIDPRNLKTPEGRQHFREGVDTMLAIGVAMGVLYPLMDSIAEAMFGEGAEQRRAGPYHLIHAAEQVVEGKKDASALIWPVFTFNPMLLSLGQLAFNKKIFSGKQIYHPDDSAAEIAGDIGEYAVKQVPQASPMISATTEEEGPTKLLARQLDIKAKSQKDLEREERAKKYQERTKKGRDTKRTKGTYVP